MICATQCKGAQTLLHDKQPVVDKPKHKRRERVKSRTELMPVNCWNSGIMIACTAQKLSDDLICAAATFKLHSKHN